MTDRTIDWDGRAVVAIDQTLLPARHTLLTLDTVDALIDAIRRLAIRGAPGLGVAGALGVALAVRAHPSGAAGSSAAITAVLADAERVATARPTAANLRWGVSRALARLSDGPEAVVAEAHAMIAEDEAVCAALATRAADVVTSLCGEGRLRVLTHCNSGALAAVSIGTGLGAVAELHRRGQVAEVLADETRPLLQGARLTAWELRRLGIPHRLCVDSAGPAAISTGMVDCVVVGADRIAANGDVANKIGTYALACAAARAGVPTVVVAPSSTVDSATPDGSAIVIEERSGDEVRSFGGVAVAEPDTPVFNPAFDVSPHELVTVVTEQAVCSGGVWRSHAVPYSAPAPTSPAVP